MPPAAVVYEDTNLVSAALQREEAPVPTNATAPAQLNAAKLIYNLTANPRAIPNEAVASASAETICTDHMVTAVWKASTGWEAPEMKPYGPLSLMPTASVLNYATECFEGMKAYRGHDGKLRLFRPDHNCARFNMSASRISLPTFDAGEMQKLIVALLSVDGPRWLSKDRAGSFLYIRPILVGTQPQIGVQTPKEALLCITTSFLPHMDSPAGGLRLHTSPEDTVRAWAGGFGYAKIGANYGPTMVAKQEAHKRGFHEVLWLYGEGGECTEAGASNFFIIWKRKDGKTELITAPLDDKLILDGVTRRSCLELVRKKLPGEIEVTERKYTIGELVEAHAEGRLLESFAAGTGYFVCPISQIHHRGKDINIPVGPGGQPGEITNTIKTWLGDILYGRTEHHWGVVVPEKQ